MAEDLPGARGWPLIGETFAFTKDMFGFINRGVKRYNGAAQLKQLLTYKESPAVTTREKNPNRDFVVWVERGANKLTLVMRNMGRVGKPDALIIEGVGVAGKPPDQDRFPLRIEGVVRDGEIGWRATCDYKEIDTGVDDLPDRLIAVIATGELTRLWTTAPFIGV